MLTPVQQQVATIVSRLPEADGFALAGAGALVLHGYIERETRDLEYFTTPAHQAGVQELGAALEAALANEGLESPRLRDLPTFVRLSWAARPTVARSTLRSTTALDVEAAPLGPTLVPKELGVNKVLAAFDRAEPRDFTAPRRPRLVPPLHVSRPPGQPSEARAAGRRPGIWRRQIEQQIEREREARDRSLGR